MPQRARPVAPAAAVEMAQVARHLPVRAHPALLRGIDDLGPLEAGADEQGLVLSRVAHLASLARRSVERIGPALAQDVGQEQTAARLEDAAGLQQEAVARLQV